MSLATAVLTFTNHLLLGRVNRARDEGDGKVREGESLDFRFIT